MQSEHQGFLRIHRAAAAADSATPKRVQKYKNLALIEKLFVLMFLFEYCEKRIFNKTKIKLTSALNSMGEGVYYIGEWAGGGGVG